MDMFARHNHYWPIYNPIEQYYRRKGDMDRAMRIARLRTMLVLEWDRYL